MEKTKKTSISFAAMNTAEGFRGYFREIFGDVAELYIIKGGPGTGKSRFMKEIGKLAEQNGRSVEYFLCSSDPTSLDGVIFTDQDGNSVGIIDGTAPHAYEPTLAGVKEHILNFGDFWDPALLIAHKTEIEALAEAKKRLYRSFYSYLSAIRALDEITSALSHLAIDGEKLSDAVRRFSVAVREGNGYSEKIRIRSAVSCDGFITLDEYGKSAKVKYAVTDSFLTAGIFMTELKKELKGRNVAVKISYSPFSPTIPDAIYIPAADTAFYIGCSCEEGEKTVNMRRFIIPEKLAPYKTKLREIAKLRKELMRLLNGDAISIRSLHEAMETLYGEAMDFTRKEALTRRLSKKFFDF